MPYSDILNSINTFGTSYNYGDYQRGVNPYSSGAYINNNVREYQKTLAAPVDPRSAYSDYKISNEDRALKGLGYYGMGQNIKFSGAGIDSFKSGLSQGIADTGNLLGLGGGDSLLWGSKPSLTGKTFKGAKDFNLGNAALVYGLTRDGNPYDQTGLESMGNVATGAMTGMKLGGPIGAGIGMLAGIGYSIWKEGNINKKNEEIDIELQEDKDEYDDKINKFMSDNREKAQSLSKSELWAQQSGGYDNQYGGHINSYGSSYYNKGGKLTPKEMKKVQSLGRNGDTQLAHINPQEAQMLKQMGGSGTINPYTGLREYSWLSEFAGDVITGVTAIPALIHDIFQGEENIGGRFLDNISFSDTRANIFGDHTVAGHQFDDQSKTAVYNSDTGEYDIQTNKDDVTLNFNPNDPTGYSINAPGGKQSMSGQITEGYGVNGLPAYQAATARDPKIYNSKRKSNNPALVTNPFRSVQSGDKKGGESNNLEGYRWDMANPYIRENVDIFDDGGVVDTTESLPMDSLLNRQIYKESAFDAAAESDAGAAGLTQIMPDTFKFFKDKGWVPEGKKFSDLKTDTALATDLQEKYMTDLLGREWNKGNDQVKRAKALAAYNMGPTKLVNKLNELKNKGVDIYNNTDWINELNAETSDYVNKILLGNNPGFEADYTTEYNKTGKNYANGGMVDAIAEFTGNELIINNQNQVELGLKEKDYAKAAAPIKDAMKKGFVTPGPESHQGNPMPVGQDGSIYANGGKLPFKVKKGAGVYDHATDQFKEGMSDEEIAMVAQENINKWKSNNMA